MRAHMWGQSFDLWLNFGYINPTVKLFLLVALCAFQNNRISGFGGKLQAHMVGMPWHFLHVTLQLHLV